MAGPGGYSTAVHPLEGHPWRCRLPQLFDPEKRLTRTGIWICAVGKKASGEFHVIHSKPATGLD